MSGHESIERRRRRDSDWIGPLSVGFFVLALGFVWIITPDFFGEVVSFVKDFQLKNLTEHIMLPAPGTNHPVLYTALSQLCLVLAFFQAIALALRFFFRDSMNKVADAAGGVVFSLGAAFFFNLLAAETLSWFAFIGGLIVSTGASIVLGSVVKLLSRS